MNVVDKYAKNNLREVYAEDDGANGLHGRFKWKVREGGASTKLKVSVNY